MVSRALQPDGYWDDVDEDDALFREETTENEKSLLALIPLMAGSNKKALYLSYRATGFPVKQAADLAEIKIGTLQRWRQQDKQFRLWEQEKLHELQTGIAREVMRLEFMRNFRMFLKKDSRVIRQSLFDPTGLTDDDKQYLMLIRKHYTPSELLRLEQALEPEKHNRREYTIKLSWDNTGEPEADLIEAPTVEGDFVTLDA